MIFRRKKADAPAVIPRDQHRVSRDDISPRAAHIVRRLRENGHETFIVGGAVRDLLLGVRPKDFDIATSAHPSQIRRLFRNSRIIGRRFRLVHVFYYQKGRHPEILEVSTFRTQGDESAVDEQGRIVEDNVYGDAKDDARRRDFTVNALFYDPMDENIIDYVGGFADIRRRALRLIGVPKVRMREDPLRVLRALRHSEKLGLNLDPATAAALRPHARLLVNISPSRLFDELLKVLLTGAAVPILRAWRRHDVPLRVFPALETLEDDPLALSALSDMDRRIREGRNASVSFAVAAMLWREAEARWQAERESEPHPQTAMERALGGWPPEDNGAAGVVSRRVVSRAISMFLLQARFAGRRTARRAKSIVRDEMFDKALALAARRGEMGDAEAAALARWWSRYASASPEERAAMIHQQAQSAPERPRSRRRKRRARSGGGSQAAAAAKAEAEAEAETEAEAEAAAAAAGPG